MSDDFTAVREIMVDSQVRTQDVTDLAVIDAMRAVRREILVPTGRSNLAYADAEIEYAPGRWMLRPRDIGKLMQALRPRAGERALALAAPYAAAVLDAIGVSVIREDGSNLTPPAGTWDMVVCEGAVSEVPASWKEAIAPGGRLVAIERNGPVGRATLYLRSPNSIGSRPLFDCTPPMMAGFEARQRFAL